MSWGIIEITDYFHLMLFCFLCKEKQLRCKFVTECVCWICQISPLSTVIPKLSSLQLSSLVSHCSRVISSTYTLLYTHISLLSLASQERQSKVLTYQMKQRQNWRCKKRDTKKVFTYISSKSLTSRSNTLAYCVKQIKEKLKRKTEGELTNTMGGWTGNPYSVSHFAFCFCVASVLFFLSAKNQLHGDKSDNFL